MSTTEKAFNKSLGVVSIGHRQLGRAELLIFIPMAELSSIVKVKKKDKRVKVIKLKSLPQGKFAISFGQANGQTTLGVCREKTLSVTLRK